MTQTRFASIVLLLSLLLVSVSTASAQEDYAWAKYTLNGYGAVDMGYICDNGRLMVAVHGEVKGSLSAALGDDDPKTSNFDGNNTMGPDGFNTQILLQRTLECDQRASWPLVAVTANGTTLKIRWP